MLSKKDSININKTQTKQKITNKDRLIIAPPHKIKTYIQGHFENPFHLVIVHFKGLGITKCIF